MGPEAMDSNGARLNLRFCLMAPASRGLTQDGEWKSKTEALRCWHFHSSLPTRYTRSPAVAFPREKRA